MKKEKKKVAKNGTKLKELLGFKTNIETAEALNIPKNSFNNFNTDRAGDTIKSMGIALIAFIEAHPVKKRRKILSNIQFKA